MAKNKLECTDKQAEQRLTLTAGAYGNNSCRANKKLIMVATEHDEKQLDQMALYGNRRAKRQAKKMLRRKEVK